ncbi:MAG: hypothetical protein ACE37E_10700 [Hyphomicrobiales bacterium]
MIVAPQRDKKAEGRRAIAEALAQLSPVTAALARIYESTHPSKYDLSVQEFHEIIAEEIRSINDHIERGSRSLSTPVFGHIRMEGSIISGEGQNISSYIDAGQNCIINFASHFQNSFYHVSVNKVGGGVAEVTEQSVGFFSMRITELDKGIVTFTVEGELA